MPVRSRAAAPFAVVATVCLLVAGCSPGGGGTETGDPLQVVDNPVAAHAARSPVPGVEPAGTVLGLDGKITALRTDPAGGSLVLARADSPAVLRYDLTDLDAGPRSVTPVPGKVTDFTFTGRHVLASVPEAGVVVRIPLSGRAADGTQLQMRGQPSATATHDSRTLVALRDSKRVLVREGAKTIKSMSGNLYSIDDILVADDETFVLDRVRTALFHVDVEASNISEGLRAGLGATNAVTDDYGRILVTDTRGGALLAFSADPFLLRQRYPVPGGIYGIAYDGKRDIAWVTLAKRNEVVGFDMTGGAPTEEYRFPTVRQPNSVTVDERTGRVIVGSATGEGLQVITP